MEDKKTISKLEDAVTCGGCIIQDAMGDLSALMEEIENDRSLFTEKILNRLKDISSTLNNFYIAV